MISSPWGEEEWRVEKDLCVSLSPLSLMQLIKRPIDIASPHHHPVAAGSSRSS